VTFDRAAASFARAAGRPWVFALAAGLIAVWGLLGPFYGWSDSHSLFINTATTIVTFLMVFLIQNTQNRDAAAIQVKLDELIRAVDKARNDLIGLERRSEAEIEEKREEIKPPAKLVERKPLPRSPWDWWGL
jgi:low affinity Fe/Cu permease